MKKVTIAVAIMVLLGFGLFAMASYRITAIGQAQTDNEVPVSSAELPLFVTPHSIK